MSKKGYLQKMKVSIGAKIIDGPWGGGNLFAKNLSNFLISKGHNVVFDLNDIDIDIILLTDPRKSSESSTYTHEEIIDYLQNINSNAVVIHRINECDERKNTRGLNKFIINANKAADSTVFVSSWLMNLYQSQGQLIKENLVILSGSDIKIFNREEISKWDKTKKLKIVTHHWGTDKNKGFEIYKKIDELIDSPEFKNLIEFTYIGNLPKNLKFKNTTIIDPLEGLKLAEALKKNNLYITASLNEPSGNHHIEAAQCGLPVMYIESGGVTEYCKGYGIPFTNDDLPEKIKLAMSKYDFYYEKMKTYPYSSDLMVEQYLTLMIELVGKRQDVSKNRNIDEVKKLYLNRIIRKITKS